MFASIRTYRFTSGSTDELMHRVDRDFADAISQEPGFAGYQVVATGERTIMSITVFESEAEAERSTELAAQWVADDLADFGVERMGAMTGEVMVSRAASSMLEPAHH